MKHFVRNQAVHVETKLGLKKEKVYARRSASICAAVSQLNVTIQYLSPRRSVDVCYTMIRNLAARLTQWSSGPRKIDTELLRAPA
jgi:hypothetical protein